MDFEIPQNCTVKIEPDLLRVKAGNEEHIIIYNSRKIKAELKDGKVHLVSLKKERRETHAMINSVWKHMKNAFAGSSAIYIKKLSVVYAHFPVSVELKGKVLSIKNFLGEKVPRQANIVGNTQVVIAGQEITIKGSGKDHVGQTAANIIQSVRIVGKDRRVFQDGIYLVK